MTISKREYFSDSTEFFMKNNLMKTQVNIKIRMFLQKEVDLIVEASDQNISTEKTESMGHTLHIAACHLL